MTAVNKGHLHVAKILVKNGANVNYRNKVRALIPGTQVCIMWWYYGEPVGCTRYDSGVLRTGTHAIIIFIAGSLPTAQLSPRWTNFTPKIQYICDNPLTLSIIHPCTVSRRTSEWRFWSS